MCVTRTVCLLSERRWVSLSVFNRYVPTATQVRISVSNHSCCSVFSVQYVTEKRSRPRTEILDLVRGVMCIRLDKFRVVTKNGPVVVQPALRTSMKLRCVLYFSFFLGGGGAAHKPQGRSDACAQALTCELLAPVVPCPHSERACESVGACHGRFCG